MQRGQQVCVCVVRDSPGLGNQVGDPGFERCTHSGHDTKASAVVVCCNECVMSGRQSWHDSAWVGLGLQDAEVGI